jgi:hypothetical protein
VTLIVAVATGNYAFHASDRYVSVQPTPKNPSGDWDLHANKTVVAIGSDCWLVLGYTGLAYLDGKPTDQLIAEAISGYDDLSGGAAFIPWFLEQYPHYREIRDRVEQKLADAYSRLPKTAADKFATLVLASGVQRKEGLISGVMFQIKAQGSTTTAEEVVPNRLRAGNYHFGAVGMVNKDIINRMDARIPSAQSLEETRDMLMDAVIETSGLTDYVGDDVMGVILDKQNNTISTHFRRADPQRQAELLQKIENLEEQFGQMATVSTPYVLTPGMIYAPSIGNPGGWSMNTGITFNFTGFDIAPGSGGGAFVAGQPRTPPP